MIGLIRNAGRGAVRNVLRKFASQGIYFGEMFRMDGRGQGLSVAETQFTVARFRPGMSRFVTCQCNVTDRKNQRQHQCENA
jgi:hypothetical protein